MEQSNLLVTYRHPCLLANIPNEAKLSCCAVSTVLALGNPDVRIPDLTNYTRENSPIKQLLMSQVLNNDHKK